MMDPKNQTCSVICSLWCDVDNISVIAIPQKNTAMELTYISGQSTYTWEHPNSAAVEMKWWIVQTFLFHLTKVRWKRKMTRVIFNDTCVPFIFPSFSMTHVACWELSAWRSDKEFHSEWLNDYWTPRSLADMSVISNKDFGAHHLAVSCPNQEHASHYQPVWEEDPGIPDHGIIYIHRWILDYYYCPKS